MLLRRIHVLSGPNVETACRHTDIRIMAKLARCLVHQKRLLADVGSWECFPPRAFSLDLLRSRTRSELLQCEATAVHQASWNVVFPKELPNLKIERVRDKRNFQTVNRLKSDLASFWCVFR